MSVTVRIPTSGSVRLHGGVANSSSWPTIEVNFQVTFERDDAEHPEKVHFQMSNISKGGTTTAGTFGYNFVAAIGFNSPDTPDNWNYIWQIMNHSASHGSSWWNYLNLANRDDYFDCTEDNVNVKIYVQCTHGDYYGCYNANRGMQCFSNGHMFYKVYTQNVSVPAYQVDYPITYDANGGVGAPNAQTKSNLAPIKLSTVIPTYDVTITHHNNPNDVLSVGREFLSWNTKADGTGTNYSPGQTYSTNAKLDLYAKWGNASFIPVAVPENLITVTYDYRGATWSPAYTTIQSPALGYNTNSSAATATYIPGTTYTTTANLDLYPIYGAATLAYNSLPVPTRTGYAFEGWYSDIDYKTKVTSDLTLTTNITLYAKWKLRPIHMFDSGNWSDLDPYVWKFVNGAWQKIAPVYGFDGANWINLSTGLAPYGIFNFGDLVGLRPEFAEGVEIAKQQSGTAAWQITTSKIYLDYTQNSRMTLGGQLRKGFYKYLYVEADAGGASRTWNSSQFGIRYVKNGKGGTDAGNVANAYIPFTQCVETTINTTGYNYIDRTVRNKTELPYWYTLPRMLTRLDLSTVTYEPFYLTMHACDCSVNIYRIWLE